MKKNVLLYILLVFLVLMNGFFLFKHFGSSSPSRHQTFAPRNFISKQLDFDTEQLKQFETIDKAHRQKMNVILYDIKATKEILFDKLSDELISNSEIDAIATQIAKKEKAKELETFRFFKSLNEICSDSQKEKLKKILKDGLRLQGPPPGRNGPPQGGLRDEARPPPPRPR
ncbi:MAG: protein CpxP [Maribacter sp.]|jgi:hypothetical protein